MPLRSTSLADSIAIALAAADIGVWEWRTGDGMTQVNTRWLKIVGYAPGELDLSGFNWYRLIHPDDVHIVHTDAIDQALHSPSGQFQIEFRMRHKDGRWVWVQSRGQIVERDAASAPLRLAGAHIDITQRHESEAVLAQAHAVLQESEARFKSLTELSSDWYWEQDENFRFVNFASNKEMTLHPAQGRFGQTRWDIQTVNLTEADWQAHREVLQAHLPFKNFQMSRQDPQGNPLWVSISGAPIFDATGQFRGYRGVGQDLTAQKAAEETIKQLAFYDQLTQLPNRQLLMERLKTALQDCKRDKHHAAVLFIDLDNFKILNDTKGHQTGDLLLQQVGTRLKACVREVDTVARFGGDEFVVILKHLHPAQTPAAVQARSVGQKILVALNEAYVLNGFEHHSTPSMGAMLFNGDQLNLDELLKCADMAMYQAKADGRNLLRFFDPDMQAAVTQRTELEAALRQGLQRGEICLYYQRVVDQARQVIGYEALARWMHPARGLVSPLEFIPLAEESGLILPLGAAVLRMACQQLALWSQHATSRYYTVSVNVSARQFRQRDFVAVVTEVLRETGANARLLKLELTESLLLTDVQDVVEKMLEIKGLGVGFSLDDFGTGYSSLSYLKSLPLDQLKIDKSFVRDVFDDPSDAAIVVSILTLAKALGLSVVAEGVETEGQLQFLLNNGCKAFQGYLFGKPLPPERL
jgi:diguanylate cyclase (GGDEF)-like protein/PAS domain S-box-containing protein